MSSQFCGSFAELINRSLLTVSEYWPDSVAADTTMVRAQASGARIGERWRMIVSLMTGPIP